MLQRDSENSAKTIHDCSDALLLGSLHDVQELPSGHFPRWKKNKPHITSNVLDTSLTTSLILVTTTIVVL